MSAKNKNALDLDALEQEGRPAPLIITYRGEEFTLLDPMLMPWRDYEGTDWNSIDAPVRSLLSEDDCARFLGLNPTVRAMEMLTEQATQHYAGVAQGEFGGSPAS